MNCLQRLIMMSLVFVLFSCATTSPEAVRSPDSFLESVAVLESGVVDNTALQESRNKTLTEELLLALTPPPSTPTQASEYFDLSVNKVGSHEFFRSLVVGTSLNMVVHPDVNGDISLDLKNVSIDDVMEIMREVYGYDYVRQGNLFQVFPDVIRTEIFPVDYLNVNRVGHSEMQVSAGKVSDSGGGGSDQNTGDGNNNQSSQRGKSGVVGTLVNTEAQADFWSELATTLAIMVETSDDHQVVVTPHVGLVMVRARPEVLHVVREYLLQVQGTLNRQVIIEAKIIEVTLNEGFQAGINWHTFGDASGGTFKPSSGVDDMGMLTTTSGSEHSIAGELLAGSADFFNPLGSAFTLSGVFGDFEAAITLLETQGTVQVLSSPRIATVNNQKAVIKVGSDEFFVTDISTNTVTAGSAINTNDSPELTPFFSGIALDVTPQISASGDVILHIHPTVSEVTEQVKIISGEPVPLASSTIRESDSIVRASDGQIVVIGGLMQNSSRDQDARVPWFGRIPMLGNAFKQKNQTSIKSELVILLRPRVVTDKTQNSVLSESLKNVKKLVGVLSSGS